MKRTGPCVETWRGNRLVSRRPLVSACIECGDPEPCVAHPICRRCLWPLPKCTCAPAEEKTT